MAVVGYLSAKVDFPNKESLSPFPPSSANAAANHEIIVRILVVFTKIEISKVRSISMELNPLEMKPY